MSVIPEGLPAVATIIMALGVVKMSKANMLVRSLPAVESLGNVSVICTDKTGTLTKNQIIVTAIAHYGDIQQNNVNDPNHLDSHYTPLIYASVLCNNATLDPDHVQQVLGDGTEGALLALDHDFLRLRQTYPKIYEQPFDSDRKLMSTIHKINNINTVYTKGAVEELLKRCNSVCYQDQILVMTDETKTKIMTMANTMMQQGLRVLSFASKKISEIPNQHNINIEYDLSFLGLVGMMDAVREEVKPVILECQKAQIKTVMITGDHQITAVAVAKQLHIFQDNNIVVNGQDLSTMTDTQLQTACAQATVFARVSPKDKLRIVKTYQASGEIVAMTGDGVNDAPALKIANVGVSMGKSGTDVAKAAADLLLLDDNFTTIAKAIREGRRIYQNILKLVMFLVAGNIAEIIVLTLAILLN